MPNSLDAACEQLITAGSDNRLLLTEGGLNPYGCSPLPRLAIPFGNCTCSSPSERGIQVARDMLERLRGASSPPDEAQRVCDEHRRRLKQLLTLPDHVDVALSSSGTDVELLVAAIAAAGHHRHLVNIIVGPTEVGSGTPLAAAGCHYDNLVPNGNTVTLGAPVSTSLADRLTVRHVDIRDQRGEMLSEFDIDALVTEIVAAESASGAQVILHLVAHSKTGMHAPSLVCVDRIVRQLGEDVTVVVDAAQGRVSRRGLRETLAAGHLVMFTGSKFYGGPPFSGALFVPPRWQPQHRGLTSLPDGFEQYFTPAEMPTSWTSIRQGLTDWQNYGCILRWTAALAEIDAYYRVDSRARLDVLREFEEVVPHLFQESPSVRMLPVFAPIEDDAQTRLLESKTTVYAFRVLIDGIPLDRDKLKILHRELNADVSEQYSHLPADVMSREFHLGQLVSFADGSAALRIALGGEMIVRVATDVRLGSTLKDRIRWLRVQLQYLRAKLEFLAAQRSADALVVSADETAVPGHQMADGSTDRRRDSATTRARGAAGRTGSGYQLPSSDFGVRERDDGRNGSEFHQRISADEIEHIWRSAAEAGLLTETTTSLLVHDLSRMRARIGEVMEAFPEGTLHALAIKANPLVEVLREAVRSGAGLEAASIEEVHLALAAGCPPDRIVFDSPAKTSPEIAEALCLGLILNANGFEELGRIDEVMQELDSTAQVGLRINPEVGAGSISQTSVGAAGSKFGVAGSDVASILAAFRRYHWLTGLHVHVGSQGCPLELMIGAAKVIDALRQRIFKETGRHVQFIDIGGGLPTIYTQGQSSPTPAEYVNALQTAGDLFASGTPLITEFGRAVQAGCGITLSRVEFIRPDQRMAVIHVGADLLMRPVYRPQDWRHEFFVLDAHGRIKRGPVTPQTIAGPLCFSGDIIARDQLLPTVEVGDWIVIRDTGAYTLSLWSRHCNRGIPAVFGYDPCATDPLRVIRPAETPADVVRFWSSELVNHRPRQRVGAFS